VPLAEDMLLLLGYPTVDMKWLAAHAREYVGQWVALDGDTLIAHGPDHRQAWAAAEASGV